MSGIIARVATHRAKDAANNRGSTVKLKPTTAIPRGRISTLKSQGAGGLRESRMGRNHTSLGARRDRVLGSHGGCQVAERDCRNRSLWVNLWV
jgi:hypothetical protein